MAMVGDKPADGIVARLFQLADELPGVGRKRFDVAALPLGEDGVEGQARLARAGDAGKDDELFLGELDVDVLEIVLAGALDQDRVEFPAAALGRGNAIEVFVRFHGFQSNPMQPVNLEKGPLFVKHLPAHVRVTAVVSPLNMKMK
jgi:hypothetical protein